MVGKIDELLPGKRKKTIKPPVKKSSQKRREKRGKESRGKMICRCGWSEGSQIYIDYHDNEWGTPVHDDGLLYEFLILEGAQAGLSWITVLKKRENYRKAFDNFDPVKIASYNDKKVNDLLLNEGIIRNRRKIEAAILNAKAFLKIKEEFGTFDNYI
jgi:DNA-3-methyladenine glycosylase I